MTPFTTLTAVAVPLDLVNVDTDRIVPARFLRQPRSAGYENFLFRDLREAQPDFPLDQPAYKAAQVLVAAENFGCGSSREGAVWALAGAGLRAWIAPSFGDIFFENSFKNGVLAIVLPHARVAELRAQLARNPGAQVTIDLPAQLVRFPDGSEVRFEIDAFRKECLVQGLDEIDLTLRHEADIVAYEERQRRDALARGATGFVVLRSRAGGPAMILADRFLAILLAILLAACASAPPAEVRVMTSGGFTAAYRELAPQFERASGHKVLSAYGASQGGAPDSIPSRLARGEPVDVVILAAPALEGLIKEGKVMAGSRVDLVHSQIGMVVRAGAPKPDISTLEAFRRTVLAAKSLGYSASASGVYLSNELFPKMGIWDEIRAKSRRIESERVASVVARGELEIGFQQVSELLEIKGVDFVGVLPEGAQRVTTFSAGIATGAKQPEAAREMVRYFTSPAAVPVIKRSGLEPAAR